MKPTPIKRRAQVEGSGTGVAIASKVGDSALKNVIKPRRFNPLKSRCFYDRL
jgi:hypothetical protein